MEQQNWPLAAEDNKDEALRLFPSWVRNTRDDLYATLMRIVRNESDAEDLLQDTYLRAIDRIGSFRGEGEPGAWLRRIAVRLALNHLRSRKLRRYLPFHSDTGQNDTGESEIQIPDPGPGPDIQTTLNQRRSRLESILNSLPAKARVAFSLRYLEDRSYRDVAELVGCSEATARSLVSRAISRLEKEIQQRGWQDE